MAMSQEIFLAADWHIRKFAFVATPSTIYDADDLRHEKKDSNDDVCGVISPYLLSLLLFCGRLIDVQVNTQQS